MEIPRKSHKRHNTMQFKERFKGRITLIDKEGHTGVVTRSSAPVQKGYSRPVSNPYKVQIPSWVHTNDVTPANECNWSFVGPGRELENIWKQNYQTGNGIKKKRQTNHSMEFSRREDALWDYMIEGRSEQCYKLNKAGLQLRHFRHGRSIQLESSPYNRVKQLEEEPKSKPDLSQIIPKTRPNNNNIRLPVLPRQGVSYPITPHRDFFVPQPAEKPQHQNKARYRFMLQKLLQRDKESQNYTLAAICGNQGVMGADILRNKRIVNTSPAGKNKYPWFAPVGGGVSLEGIRPWFESRPKP